MSQARTDHHYSLQDVLDVVLNGEIDVDILLDESDEESDEEACGEPTDCLALANVDIEPQPVKDAKTRDRYRWQNLDFTCPDPDFSGPPVTEDVSSLHTPLEYFRQFVSKDMIQSAVVNAWLLYKRDCKTLKVSKKETLNMRRFQAQLLSSLILVDTVKTPKRGRSSSGNGSPETQITGSPLNAQKRPSSEEGNTNSVPPKRSCEHPPLDVRKDLVGHFPMKTQRGRCRHCPQGYTNTQCRKCGVRLCFSEARDCFWDYHCK